MIHPTNKEEVRVSIRKDLYLIAYKVGKDWIAFLFDPIEEKIISKYPQVL